MEDQPQFNRRKDDWVRIPRGLVTTVVAGMVLGLPTAIGGGIWYMSHQADSLSAFNDHVASLAVKVDELRTESKARDAVVDQRVQALDAYERQNNDRMIRLEAALAYLVHTSELQADPRLQPAPGNGKPR